MKKLLPIAFAIMCFCSQAVVFAEADTEQGQYLSDTKAVIAVQKQPSQESNQKQTVSNIRWSIVVQVQGKAIDKSDSDNK